MSLCCVALENSYLVVRDCFPVDFVSPFGVYPGVDVSYSLFEVLGGLLLHLLWPLRL